MTSTTKETESPAALLPFARPVRDGGTVLELWAVPTSADNTTSIQEAQMRALAVLALDMPGESEPDLQRHLADQAVLRPAGEQCCSFSA